MYNKLINFNTYYLLPLVIYFVKNIYYFLCGLMVYYIAIYLVNRGLAHLGMPLFHEVLAQPTDYDEANTQQHVGVIVEESSSPPLDEDAQPVNDEIYQKQISEISQDYKGIFDEIDRNADGLTDNKVHDKASATDEKSNEIREAKRSVIRRHLPSELFRDETDGKPRDPNSPLRRFNPGLYDG